MDLDTANLLSQARDEIEDLRRVNSLMSAKLEGIEMMHQAVCSVSPPPGPQGMKVDVLWKIDEKLREEKRGGKDG